MKVPQDGYALWRCIAVSVTGIGSDVDAKFHNKCTAAAMILAGSHLNRKDVLEQGQACLTDQSHFNHDPEFDIANPMVHALAVAAVLGIPHVIFQKEEQYQHRMAVKDLTDQFMPGAAAVSDTQRSQSRAYAILKETTAADIGICFAKARPYQKTPLQKFFSVIKDDNGNLARLLSVIKKLSSNNTASPICMPELSTLVPQLCGKSSSPVILMAFGIPVDGAIQLQMQNARMFLSHVGDGNLPNPLDHQSQDVFDIIVSQCSGITV